MEHGAWCMEEGICEREKSEYVKGRNGEYARVGFKD